jgi:hypothetical protein
MATLKHGRRRDPLSTVNAASCERTETRSFRRCSMTTYSRAARRVAAAHTNTHIICLAVCTPSTRPCCRDTNRLLPSIAPAQSFINDDRAS